MGCVSKTDYLPRDVGWVHVLPSVSVSLHRTETGFWWEEAITRALAPALLGQGRVSKGPCLQLGIIKEQKSLMASSKVLGGNSISSARPDDFPVVFNWISIFMVGGRDGENSKWWIIT